MDDKYTDLAVQVAKTESRSKSNETRLDAHDKKLDELDKKQDAIYELASSVKSIATDMTYIKEDVKDVKSGQKEMSNKITILENRPANETKKRIDEICEKLIWLVVGGIAVGILSQILPNVPW